MLNISINLTVYFRQYDLFIRKTRRLPAIAKITSVDLGVINIMFYITCY